MNYEKGGISKTRNKQNLGAMGKGKVSKESK
jgi:hypothetical protein